MQSTGSVPQTEDRKLKTAVLIGGLWRGRDPHTKAARGLRRQKARSISQTLRKYYFQWCRVHSMFLYTLLTGTRAQEMCLFCVAWDEVKCGPTLKSRKQMKKWSYAVTKHTSQCYVYDRNTEHIITDSFKTRDTLRYTELVLVLLTVYVHPFCPP